MSKEDLLNLIPSSKADDEFSTYFKKKLSSPYTTIINICMSDGELVKIGSGSKIKKDDVVEINSTFITIQYDSHETNYFIHQIVKVEYY